MYLYKVFISNGFDIFLTLVVCKGDEKHTQFEGFFLLFLLKTL